MRVITSVTEMQREAEEWQKHGRKVGLVPTMGYLHRGHVSLMKAAREENDIVVASIFVNPTQFGPSEDYERYPRDLEADARKAEAVGVDVIFAPNAEEMYPRGYITYVQPEELSGRLCGASRPGHFRGVCTVVLKLFHIIRPTHAYFGQKDAQQYIILERMARDLNLPVAMRRMPIIREQDGLALSSRNIYLSEEERKQAVALYHSLSLAGQLYAGGERGAEVIRKAMESELRKALLGEVEYLAIVDTANLLPVEKLKGQVLIALAVRFGSTRLIDNIIVG